MLWGPIFSVTSLFQSLYSFEGTGYATYITALSTILSSAVHTISALLLRVCSFATLFPIVGNDSNLAISTRNPMFHIVWWSALGWSIAEATIGTTQGYHAIGLYKEVLVSGRRKSKISHSSQFEADNIPSPRQGNENGKGKQVASSCDDVPLPRRELNAYGTLSNDQATFSTNVAIPGEREPLLRKGSDLSVITSSSFASLSLHPSIAWDNPAEQGDVDSEESELQVQVDRDIDHLLAFRKREELEELYGMPFIVSGHISRVSRFIEICRRKFQYSYLVFTDSTRFYNHWAFPLFLPLDTYPHPPLNRQHLPSALTADPHKPFTSSQPAFSSFTSFSRYFMLRFSSQNLVFTPLYI
jgi:hypothetical protein